MFGSLIPATQLAAWAAMPWPEPPRACGLGERGLPSVGTPLTEDIIHRAVQAIESGSMDDLLVADCGPSTRGQRQPPAGHPGIMPQPACVMWEAKPSLEPSSHITHAGPGMMPALAVAVPGCHAVAGAAAPPCKPLLLQPHPQAQPLQSQPQQQQQQPATGPATRSSEGSDATLTPAASTAPSMEGEEEDELSKPKRQRTSVGPRGQRLPKGTASSSVAVEPPWAGNDGRRRSSGRPSLHDLAAAALALAGEGFGSAEAPPTQPATVSFKDEQMLLLQRQQAQQLQQLQLQQQQQQQMLEMQLQQQEQEELTEAEGLSPGGSSFRKRKVRTIPLQQAASTVTLEKLCSVSDSDGAKTAGDAAFVCTWLPELALTLRPAFLCQPAAVRAAY